MPVECSEDNPAAKSWTRQSCPQAESARGKTYTIRALQKTLGVSRNTLLYYEKLGLLSPEINPETGYRCYTNADVFRALEDTVLRNVGFDLQAILNMQSSKDPDPTEEALSQVDRRLAWFAAARENLADLKKTSQDARETVPRLVKADIYHFFADNAETGYENIEQNEVLAALLDNFPVAAPAIIIGDDFFSREAIRPRWGRAVAERQLEAIVEVESLLHAHAGQETTLGGSPCLTLAYHVDGSQIPGFDPDRQVRSRVEKCLEDKGLEVAGTVFAVNAFPVMGVFHPRLMVPVKARTVAGRIALLGLR